MNFLSLFTSKKEAVLKTDELRRTTQDEVNKTKAALEHKATDLTELINSTLVELRQRGSDQRGIHPKHGSN